MPRKRRPYHHGDLKQTLLDSAVDLMATEGAQALTLREVARRAGVSHNAPYRHFTDKDDLLAAVAAQGFDRLTAAMTEAMRDGSTAIERLRLAGRGYVEFAMRAPSHLVIMFETSQPAQPRPQYKEAGLRAFQVLLDAIAAVQNEGGLPAGDPIPLAIAAWASVHGLAKLSAGGRLPFDAGQTIAFADYLSRALLRGMANVKISSG